MEITFNEQQQTAVAEITENLIKGEALTWTLMGYAGTGKSTLAAYLAKVANKENLCVNFVAPTNKAVQVLRDMGNDHCNTVHKMIYYMDEQTGEFEKKCSPERYELALEKLHAGKLEFDELIICDEASMLSDAMLDDLEEYAICFNAKVLYMGDPFQLPPVEKYSRTVFDNENRSFLTEVMRQGKGSSVLAWATALRKKKLSFSPTKTEGEVSVEDRYPLWNEYLKKLKEGKDITMVTWKNDARVRFNLSVRKVLGYEGKTLQKGEPIMGISNGIYLRNGETETVPENIKFLGKDQIFQNMYGKEATQVHNAEFYSYVKDDEKHLIILVPDYAGASIPSNSIKGTFYWYLEGGFKKQFVTTSGKKKKKYKLSEEVTICTYGYAVTAHKSQGSQWDEVFITGTSKLFDDPLINARWLYTAVTRAKEKVHMLKGECSRQLSWGEIDALV